VIRHLARRSTSSIQPISELHDYDFVLNWDIRDPNFNWIQTVRNPSNLFIGADRSHAEGTASYKLAAVASTV
jgi:hypothetical protein